MGRSATGKKRIYEVKTVIHATKKKAWGSHNHITRICTIGGLCDFSMIMCGLRHYNHT